MEKLSISRFWRKRTEHYTFVGRRCKNCGKTFYPPKHRCPYCGSSQLEEYVPPNRGKLISWTKLYEVPSGYDQYKPIYLALVQLGELRILTQLTDIVNEDKLKPGMEVETVLRRVTEDGNYGLIYYGLKVRPVE